MVEPNPPKYSADAIRLLDFYRANRKEAHRTIAIRRREHGSSYVSLENYVHDVGERNHQRVVVVDPVWLDNYLEDKSYQDWVDSQDVDDSPKFGEYISGLGLDEYEL